MRIVILPPWWSTWWFRLAVVTAVGFTVLLFYRLRLHEVTRRLNLIFEERFAERTRIARDFHDTLLQSFQGVLLNFHAVTYQLSDRPEAAGHRGRREQARHAITEGRRRGLRLKHEDQIKAATAGWPGARSQSVRAGCSRVLRQCRRCNEAAGRILANEIYHIIEAVRNCSTCPCAAH